MIASPFSEVALAYRDRGYSIIPIKPGEKAPGAYGTSGPFRWSGLKEWQRYCDAPVTDEQLAIWLDWPDAGIGIALGAASNLIALDFDHRADLHNAIQQIIPASPVRKTGAKGFTAFYRFNGWHTRRWQDNTGSTVVELLSTGRQTVLPPSVHPDGMAYRWLTPETLLDIPPSELPEITEEHIAALDAFFGKHEQKHHIKSTCAYYEPRDDDLERAALALRYLSADDYNDWVRYGMAIHSRDAGPAGFAVWETWSKTSAKNKPDDCEKKWPQLNGSSVNISTIFYDAKARGWIDTSTPPTRGPAAEILPGGNLMPIVVPKETPAAQSTAVPVMAFPVGLVGDIARWITSTAIYPQPNLALGAAIACVGAVKGHRVQTETRLRTNVLCLAHASSGAGKGHAIEAIEALLDRAGLTELFGGEPKSDSALLTLLRNNRGVRLIQWDEFGLALKSLTDKRAAKHERGIIQTMMKLFSKGASVAIGDEYANRDGKMQRQDIQQPCLCVYATTTPVRLYEAMTGDHVVDGFFPRWLVFEGDNDPPRYPGGDIWQPPQDIIERLIAIQQMPTNAYPQSAMDGDSMIRPAIIPLTAAARDELAVAYGDFDTGRRRARGINLDAFWARGIEHALKLALIASDGDEIDELSMLWALELSKSHTERICAAVVARLSGSQHETNVLRVLDVIQRLGPIAAGDLLRQTRWLTKRQRGEVLEHLLEAGEVVVEALPTATRPATVYRAV